MENLGAKNSKKNLSAPHEKSRHRYTPEGDDLNAHFFHTTHYQYAYMYKDD